MKTQCNYTETSVGLSPTHKIQTQYMAHLKPSADDFPNTNLRILCLFTVLRDECSSEVMGQIRAPKPSGKLNFQLVISILNHVNDKQIFLILVNTKSF